MKKTKNDPSEIRITHRDFLLVANPHDSLEDIKNKFPHIHFSHHMSSNYIYVVDDNDKLVGVASIGEVLFSQKNQKIADLMHTKLVTAKEDINKYRIAHLSLRHNLKAIPIVDDQHHLIGAVNSDQILRYLYEIHHKKIFKLAGILPHPNISITSPEIPVKKAFLHRIGWILVGLFGGIFGAQIIGGFEHILQSNLVLASFIPLIVYISDAVGTQTQSFFIRDIALNPKIKIMPYIVHQVIITSLIGLVCSGVIWGIVNIIWGQSYVGFTVGLSAFVSILFSTFIAIVIPYFLFLVDQDPADGGGPFATIIQDLASILVYFCIATALLY